MQRTINKTTEGGVKVPCNTITKVSLEFKNADLGLLTKTIVNLGLGVRDYAGGLIWNGGSYNKITGKLTARSEAEGQQIKRSYSGEIVKAQASRFGWTVKQTDTYKYQIMKR